MRDDMPDDLQTKLTHDQITAICQRGFGRAARVESVREMRGGTVNETYAIGLAAGMQVVLRVAPPAAADTYWDDVALMRREHHILPFFADIAAWMPRVILTDFTRQVIGRDYVLQTYVEGKRWSDIEDELTEEENIALWRRCGEVVRWIHRTTGERFGHPPPGRAFTTWSRAVLDRFDKILESMLTYQLDVAGFSAARDAARSAASLLDEIRTPHLLHGDLWTFNLLVADGSDRPAIAAVLDVDRAWWGDPMADWIMFLWGIRRDRPEWKGRFAAFRAGYGTGKDDEATRYRREVYKAMHIGSARVWAARNEDEGGIARAGRELREIAQALCSWRTN
jgi:aminoglycoside phosphotransferase (APT) family kinase protein